MRAGLLKQKIDIESNATTVDSFGDVVDGWTAYASDVPATVTPLRGVEQDGQGQVNTKMTHKVTIRYSSSVSAVSPKHRIKYGSKYFDILSVINVREGKRMIEIECVEHG